MLELVALKLESIAWEIFYNALSDATGVFFLVLVLELWWLGYLD